MRARLQSVVARLAGACGLETAPRGAARLVPLDFYSPIPDVSAVPADTWNRPSPMRGIDFDLEAQMRFIERDLAPFIAEFEARMSAGSRWRPRNGLYDAGDGELTYAMLRFLRPDRVVELGSGWSTLVLADAVAANRADGASTRLTSYDPFPSPVVPGDLEGLDRLEPMRAQDVPDTVFESLTTNDVLFVDTTHAVKVGSDVNRIVLDVLPGLSSGVHVHFHDVFLPYEYHRDWAENGPWWSEQYLVQAFLALNPEYSVVLATHALLRQRRAELCAVVSSIDDQQPSSFWMARS
jgi:hypothetical protein